MTLSSRLWFLIFSNITLILPSGVLLYKGYKQHHPPNLFFFAWEISIFAMAGPISALYHLCDSPEIRYCTANYNVLLFLDFLFSYSIITCIVSPYIPDIYRQSYRLFMTCLTTFLILFFTMNTAICASILIGINTFIFLSLHGREAIQSPIHFPGIWIGFFLIIIAIYFKFFQSDPIGQSTPDVAYKYALFHGLWHFIIGLGMTIFLMHVQIIQYYSDLELSKKYESLSSTPKQKYSPNNNNNNNNNNNINNILMNRHQQKNRRLKKQLKISIDTGNNNNNNSPIDLISASSKIGLASIMNDSSLLLSPLSSSQQQQQQHNNINQISQSLPTSPFNTNTTMIGSPLIIPPSTYNQENNQYSQTSRLDYTSPAEFTSPRSQNYTARVRFMQTLASTSSSSSSPNQSKSITRSIMSQLARNSNLKK